VSTADSAASGRWLGGYRGAGIAGRLSEAETSAGEPRLVASHVWLNGWHAGLR